MLFIYIFISIAAGITVVIGRVLNSRLAEQIGTLQGTLMNNLVGFIFSIMFLFLSSEAITLAKIPFNSIPFWAYLGGAIGVVVVILSNYITPRISTFYSTLLLFLGQLFVGIIIDCYILKDFSIGKLVGGILVLIGLIYNLWVDQPLIEKSDD